MFIKNVCIFKMSIQSVHSKCLFNKDSTAILSEIFRSRLDYSNVLEIRPFEVLDQLVVLAWDYIDTVWEFHDHHRRALTASFGESSNSILRICWRSIKRLSMLRINKMKPKFFRLELEAGKSPICFQQVLNLQKRPVLVEATRWQICG